MKTKKSTLTSSGETLALYYHIEKLQCLALLKHITSEVQDNGLTESNLVKLNKSLNRALNPRKNFTNTILIKIK